MFLESRIVTYQYRNLIDDLESLIEFIKYNKNIDDVLIKQIIYSGGLSTEQLKLIKPYNIKFLQQYHNFMNEDCQQQKQCYETNSHKTNDIPQKLLKITFALIQQWLNNVNHKIVIFGSAIIPLFSPTKINITDCQTEDIDVAVQSIADGKDLILFVASELNKMMIEHNSVELINILGDDVRFKYINVCQIGQKFFIRIDLCDKCPNFHFLKRFRLLDVSLVSDFLSKTEPSNYPNIELQSTVSFLLGIYDKYAGCLLNVNKLTNLQQQQTKEKMEVRIANLSFDKSALSLDDFHYFIDKFQNIHNCAIVKEMIKNIFVLH